MTTRTCDGCGKRIREGEYQLCGCCERILCSECFEEEPEPDQCNECHVRETVITPTGELNIEELVVLLAEILGRVMVIEVKLDALGA